MKLINLLCFAIVMYIGWQTYEAQHEFDKVIANQQALQLQVNKLHNGVKAFIEAEALNLQIDSTFQHFHGNVWVPRDKFLLDKQSKASADKARNLMQALEQLGKIDSAFIQSKITFNDNETDKVSKSPVSFRK